MFACVVCCVFVQLFGVVILYFVLCVVLCCGSCLRCVVVSGCVVLRVYRCFVLL